MTFPARRAGAARGLLLLLLLPLLLLLSPACGRKARPEPLRGKAAVIHAFHTFPAEGFSSSRRSAPR